MRITKDPVLGSWLMAEGEYGRRIAENTGKTPCDNTRLLIVDDEFMVRQAFSRILAHAIPTVSIDVAANGQEGVASWQTFYQAVILMDLNMPVMDGMAAFLELKRLSDEEKRTMPCVVFCTGYNPPSGIREIVADDASHCMLRKPVSNDVLAGALKTRLGISD